MQMKRWCLGAAAVLFTASFASAGTFVVLPGDPGWVSTGNSGGGSSAVTGTAPRSGNGSLELKGDRTRFFHSNAGLNLGLLSQVSTFTFDWMVGVASTHHT